VFESIADYVDPKVICLQVNATRWVSVVALLGQRLVACGRARPGFVESLIARERERPTGVRLDEGLDVALPRTDPELVIRPSLALATLARPVLFGAANDPAGLVPVRLVLLMASSERSAHTRALRRVTGMFQNGRTIENLVGARSIAFIAASICNSSDAFLTAPSTGQLADDLRFLRVERVREEAGPPGAAERIERCC
jgi:PTS system galactitol-specific IIA component